jgi:hypothetical protein
MPLLRLLLQHLPELSDAASRSMAILLLIFSLLWSSYSSSVKQRVTPRTGALNLLIVAGYVVVILLAALLLHLT